jgi:DNA mismatch endonuclease Vsr
MDRSENMSRIRGKNTKPELIVRKLLRELGFTGYRIHRTDLPGKPDVAFIGRKLAVMVHGCFWHGHTCKEGSRRPKSNQDYWLPKITRNQNRDAFVMAELTDRGWGVLTIWECELRDRVALAEKLGEFMRTCKAAT